MRNAHSRTWNMSRKQKNVERATKTMFTWNMARNTQKKVENEKCTL
jgi:hypothetical protein